MVEDLSSLLDQSGRVAFVTGASRGIGRSIAETFAQAGAKVALVARGKEVLEATAAELAAQYGAENIRALPTDVADEGQVAQAVTEVVEQWGRLDILINNAGLIGFGPLEDISPGQWNEVIAANLTGAYLCSYAAAPHLRRQQSGHIVNISSVSAQTGGVSGGVHYSASKGGMLALTKALARDLAADHITVNSIAPGQIDADPNLLTPEARERVLKLIPLGKIGQPADIAYAALFLCSQMASYITGATIDVNGGILKR
jgi:NAD(P)-dependent dehydrogenase (short-subunit alcohol dehydrogenase family)